MKKPIQFLLGVIVVLLIVVAIKTMTFTSLQVKTEPAVFPVFGNESAANLSKAITFPTISFADNSPIDTTAFLGFHKFLSEAYPLINSKLEKELISGFSLLYTWKGKNPALKPVILMAHMDVVPVEAESSWKEIPFSGDNDGTYIWGRGTLDDKSSMISILEAVEKLISEDYQPERTIYLAFGHDEEVGGLKGAQVIASKLKERGVTAEFILDEGMAITLGMVPMISKPVALIGTSEKGYLSVKLTVEMEGGHSSTPEKESAVTVLNKSLYHLHKKELNARISVPVEDFIRYIGPEMPLYAKAIFANSWLFKDLILKIYTGSSSGNSLVRTTTAPTIINAGIKDNVIPTKAEAVVNFRILPGETSADVLQHVSNVISDQRVKITAIEGFNEPSPTSPVNVTGFKIISASIRQVFPEVIVSPTLMLASSDSRKFSDISQNIFKFAPIVVTSEDMARIHGLNERVKISDFMLGIGFYYQLIKNTDK